ncbi:universal stress protein [Oecophyllibacter saccharovorans]|uniref:universal stress protein n=1 Tax=Oecophyllibacter saccharovorans TaxID=2558360 RepID=UPI0011683F10|nr:universal stress protein [Oecophyllibacter saccharovorans]TPW34761.1 universal stress protein [Oecophyllibacter saccharovorans]
MASWIRNIFLSLNGTTDPAPLLRSVLVTAHHFRAGITAVLLEGHTVDEAPLAGNGLAVGAVSTLVTESRNRLSSRLEDIRATLEGLAERAQLTWSESTWVAGKPANPLYPPAGGPTPHLHLIRSRGTLTRTLKAFAQLTDLAALPHPRIEDGSTATQIRNELLRQKCVPLLLAPPEGLASSPQRIAIIWNEALEDIRTLHQGLPWFQAARTVHVLSTSPKAARSAPQLLAYLQLHKVAAVLEPFTLKSAVGPDASTTNLSDPANLLALIEQLSVDLVVTGLHATGNLRNLLLGPPNDSIAQQALLPVLACG